MLTFPASIGLMAKRSGGGGGGALAWPATNRTYLFDPDDAAHRTTQVDPEEGGTYIYDLLDVDGNAELSLQNDSLSWGAPAFEVVRGRGTMRFNSREPGSDLFDTLWAPSFVSWDNYVNDATLTHTFHAVWRAPATLPSDEQVFLISYDWNSSTSRFMYGLTADTCRPFFEVVTADGTTYRLEAAGETVVPNGFYLVTYVCNDGQWGFYVNASDTGVSGGHPPPGTWATTGVITSFNVGTFNDASVWGGKPLRGHLGAFMRYSIAQSASDVQNLYTTMLSRYPV